MQRRGKGREERKVRQNKDYPTSVIAAGCVCRWTVMLRTVLEIPAAGKGSPSIHLSVLPLILPAVPTVTHPLPCSWKTLTSTWLNCSSMPSSNSCPFKVFHDNLYTKWSLTPPSRPWRQWEAVCCVPVLAIECFLPLAALKFCPGRAQACLSFFYHDSLSSYSVVNTLDLVLNDVKDSLKILCNLKKPKT